MTPYELGAALWRQRVLVVLVVLVTAAAVVVGVVVAPKTYTATGRLTVTAALTGDPQDPQDPRGLDEARATLAELAGSRLVAEAISADLADEAGVVRAAETLRRSIRGEWVQGTAVVEVVARDRDPRVAALVAQEALDALQVDVPVSPSVAFTETTSPRPPATYSQPDLRLIVGAGTLLAIVLACLATLVRDRRRLTVEDGGVAEDAVGAPLLAHVRAPLDPTALPALRPGTVAADGFRHLRRALESHSGSEPADLVVVAGLGGVETHVWVGANLAISLAGAGRSVLLVDGRLADHAGRAMGETPGTLGLLEVMAGASLDDALSPGPVEGLSVLPAGEASAAGPHALVERAFAEVMEQARSRFDVVVVLPPPLQRSDDAQVMAAHGSMLLTVPAGTVSVASLRRYGARTRAAGTRLLGVVLVGGHAQDVR